MKITIEGSPKELAKVLNGSEIATEIRCLMEHTITFTDDELYTLRYSIAQRISRHEDLISRSRDPIAIKNLSENLATLQAIADKITPLSNGSEEDDKINKLAEDIRSAGKENAPQAETAVQKTNQEIFEKQMKLLSEASEFCVGNLRYSDNLYGLTRAIIEIQPYLGG